MTINEITEKIKNFILADTSSASDYYTYFSPCENAREESPKNFTAAVLLLLDEGTINIRDAFYLLHGTASQGYFGLGFNCDND